MSHCFSKLPSYVSCNFADSNTYRCISVAWAISLVGWSLASVAVLTQRTKAMGEWCKADIMTNHVKKTYKRHSSTARMDDNINKNNNNVCSRKSNPSSSWAMVGWHQRTGKGLGNMSNEASVKMSHSTSPMVYFTTLVDVAFKLRWVDLHNVKRASPQHY